ncbi:condensation domain-containing protein [Roseateles sp. YR242]|uniref:condensation domain-containing protein n=1 Tax=Roseateles sp. YR242 TaxID=1855305 RepID=UPI0015A57129|nr:condensation domain-containing protein [Roseateles sp. YR242]
MLSPASAIQTAMWVESLEGDDPSLYNVTAGWFFESAIDVQRLRQAFTELVRNHSILTSRFVIESGCLCFESTDAAAMGAETDLVRTEEHAGPLSLRSAQDWVQTCSAHPFDLETGPLVRLHIRSSSGAVAVALAAHHLVVDAVSFEHLVRELGQRHAGKHAGMAFDPVPGYGVFVEAQQRFLQGHAAQEARAYWSEYLAPLASIERRAPFGRWREQQPLQERRQLAPAELNRLLRLSAQLHCTPFQILSVVLAGCIGEAAALSLVCIGYPISLREPATAAVIGPVLNTLPLLVRTGAGNGERAALIQAARDDLLMALEHVQLPFSELTKAFFVAHQQPARDLVAGVVSFVVRASSDGVNPALDGQGAVNISPLPVSPKFPVSLHVVRQGSDMLIELESVPLGRTQAPLTARRLMEALADLLDECLLETS